MPFISCLVSNVATEWSYLLFLPPILRANPTKRSWYQPVYTNFYTFSAELCRPTGLFVKCGKGTIPRTGGGGRGPLSG